jgi:hypothetical protein
VRRLCTGVEIYGAHGECEAPSAGTVFSGGLERTTGYAGLPAKRVVVLLVIARRLDTDRKFSYHYISII